MCKISVIIPVFNAQDTISDTLKSIQSQTIKNIEILCIDDGSTDKSAEIIKEIQKQDTRIRYEYQSNQGAGAARNNGIDIAVGEFIAFMDADDKYVDIYALEKLYMAAEENNALICGGSAHINGAELNSDNKRAFKTNGFIKFSDYQFDFLIGRFIYSRSLINNKNIRFPNLRVYEDPLFLVKALIAAGQFYALSEDIYFYDGSHQSQTMNSEKTKDYLKGIIEELNISSQYGLASLHKTVFERLEKEACYYSEKYLYSDDSQLLCLLLDANNAIDKELIGLDKNYVLPAITSLWNAGKNYMKLRNKKSIKFILNLLKK